MNVRALGVSEMAGHAGATHVAIVEGKDFTSTTPNEDDVFSLALAPGEGFSLLYAELEEVFATTVGGGIPSLVVNVGDLADKSRYLTNLDVLTAPGAFGEPGGLFYATQSNVSFAFNPDSDRATSDFATGRVAFYFVKVV